MPTRTAHWGVDPATLPPDAIRPATLAVIVQDLILHPAISRFVRAVWFVPTTGAPITVRLPAPYQGAFGPPIQALT